MKKPYIFASIIICLILLSIIFKTIDSVNNTSNSTVINKVEVSKITTDDKNPFDIQKMNVIKTWDLTYNDEAKKLLLNKSVLGDLEPPYQKIEDSSFSAYYLKITYHDNSIEEWMLYLDNKFEKDGVAENKSNRNRYVLITKEYVKKIGKLLEQ